MENGREIEIYEANIERDFEQECLAVHGRIQVYLGQWRKLRAGGEQQEGVYEESYQTDPSPEGSSSGIVMRSESVDHVNIIITPSRTSERSVRYELTMPQPLKSTYTDKGIEQVVAGEVLDETEYDRLYELARALYDSTNIEEDRAREATFDE
jgi:hypothetical protein